MKTSISPLFLPALLIIICLSSLGGCLTTGGTEKWQPLKKKPAALVHTVQWPEETLTMVAAWYTGQGKNWKLLANGNPNIVPSHLRVGDRIFIQHTLLRRRTPMTRLFVETNQAKLKRTPRQQDSKKRSSPPKLLRPTTNKIKVESTPSSSPGEVLAGPDDGDFTLFGPK